MCIADEVTVAEDAGDGMHFYLSERYRKLPPGAAGGESIYQQVATQLKALGANLYSRPPYPEGAWYILLLCPGVFADPTLADEIAHLLKRGVPFGHKTASKRANASDGEETAGDEAVDRSRLVPLFSTALPFGDYMSACPSDLWDMGCAAAKHCHPPPPFALPGPAAAAGVGDASECCAMHVPTAAFSLLCTTSGPSPR